MLEPCKKTDAMRTEEQHEEHGHGSPSAVPTVDSSDAGEPARRVHQRPACAQQLYGSLCFFRATQHLRTAAVLIIAAIGSAYAAQTETKPPIIEGWFFAGNTVAAMLDILAANGDGGAIAEIGVHHGRSVIEITVNADALLFHPVLAIDLFSNQTQNFDHSGRGDRAIFEEHLSRNRLSKRVVIHDGSSLEMTAAKVLSLTGGVRVAFFSVDGCHTYGCTMMDLELARASLADGGIIMVDDYMHPRWPGVTNAIGAFLHLHSSDMAGLAYGENKFYMTKCHAVGRLSEALLSSKRCHKKKGMCKLQRSTTVWHPVTQGGLVDIACDKRSTKLAKAFPFICQSVDLEH